MVNSLYISCNTVLRKSDVMNNEELNRPVDFCEKEVRFLIQYIVKCDG